MRCQELLTRRYWRCIRLQGEGQHPHLGVGCLRCAGWREVIASSAHAGRQGTAAGVLCKGPACDVSHPPLTDDKNSPCILHPRTSFRRRQAARAAAALLTCPPRSGLWQIFALQGHRDRAHKQLEVMPSWMPAGR